MWRAFDLLGPGHDDALLKLRFERGTDTLPLHTHLHSDRVIIVLDGRGFFYAADDPKCAHSDDRLRSIAVRKHDAVVFTRGVVHTFTAPVEPLTLLSYHAPFIPLEDIAQYTVADGAANESAENDRYTVNMRCSRVVAPDRLIRMRLSPAA